MLNIELLVVGKLSQRFLQEGAAEYQKRIRSFFNLTVTELPEQRPDGGHEADILRAMELEGEKILKALEKRRATVVALAVEGKQESSETLAAFLNSAQQKTSEVVFVIGGSSGLSDSVKKRADSLMSMSSMTFPHQLARVILLEQIYRAGTINAGITYHK